MPTCFRSHINMPATVHAVYGLIILVGAHVTACGAEESSKALASPQSPLSTADSLRHFRLHPKLRIELVASEPDVVDPVAIRFDEDGRMWVVEMGDYPNGPKPGEPPKSRIRVLEDRDGDGRYETSRIFADGLLFATGIQPWRGGVIATVSGQVVYLRDTTGDGTADVHEIWFAGFAEKNPQLRANHPTFALDNHIYVANGLRGGSAVAKKKEWSENAKPVSVSGMDFRFDARSGDYEAVSGNGQFGLTFDDFGNRFVCSNRNPCDHVVLEDRYVKRNRFLAVRSVVENVSLVGAESRIFPISRIWTTSTLHAGQFTAACGVTIYRGDALPGEFRGNSFTCDPTGNLVHRDVLEPSGATFSSQPGREGIEFLATTDEWFRAVNLDTGPDGALYVVDMYRAVIEHPQWVPDELKGRPDERFGDDRGRIYRIVPIDFDRGRNGRPVPRLSKSSSGELVKFLEHSNSWHRETAARLLYERQDKSVRDELVFMVKNGGSPQARVQALWVLEGLEELPLEAIETALMDAHPRVQEQAVRLAEQRFQSLDFLPKRTIAAVTSLTNTTDARLAFQTALTMGVVLPNVPTASLLGPLAARNANDRWTRTAVQISAGNHPVELFWSVVPTFAKANWRNPGALDLVEETTELIGSRQKTEEIRAIIMGLTLRPPVETPETDLQAIRIQLAGLNGLARGVNRRGKRLRAYIETLPPQQQANVLQVFEQAGTLALDGDLNEAIRLDTIALLRHAEDTLAVPTLLKLARQQANQPVRLAAIRALSDFSADEIGKILLSDFKSATPPARRAILDCLLANTSRTKMLLDEIAAKRITVTELDPTRVNRLTGHRDGEIKKQAAKLLAAAIPADRKKVLAAYQPALTRSADANQGREVFKKNCMACHRIGKLGVNVAPDIADSRTKTPSQLLVSILDPNRAIDNNYFSYTIVTIQGKTETGVIAAETASSITLRQQENKTVTVLRDDIEEMRSNGISLMPVGLEKNITLGQMADLISFIKNWRYIDGRVPIKAGR